MNNKEIINVMQLADIIVNLGIEQTKKDLTYSFTNLKLQKLLYFTTLEYCKKYNNVLIDAEFEKWTYGPMVKEIFIKYNKFGFAEITESQISETDEINLAKILKNNKNIKKNIQKTFNAKLKLTLQEFVDQSHEGPLWSNQQRFIKPNDILALYGK